MLAPAQEAPVNNPFQSPSSIGGASGASNGPRGTGTIDIALAVREAWDATIRNLGTLWMAFFAMLIVIMLSVLMCVVPAIVVAPVVGWGFYRLILQSLDGRASIDTLFSGFQDVGSVWMRSFGVSFILSLLFMAVALVCGGLMGAGYAVGEFAGLAAASLIALPLLLVAIVVMLRFGFANWMIVDAPMSATDAISRSWEETGPVWTQLILLALVTIAISLGVTIAETIVTLPIQLILAQAGEAGAALGALISGVIQLAVTPLSTAFTSLIAASAYRQAVGSVQAG
jgi:membrane-anchored glycerophosphoryl diester phosphodiesterase (GDPDase)